MNAIPKNPPGQACAWVLECVAGLLGFLNGPEATRAEHSAAFMTHERADTRPDEFGNHERAMEWGESYGPTTDHGGRTQRTSTVKHGH
jgi:hypothetical protein